MVWLELRALNTITKWGSKVKDSLQQNPAYILWKFFVFQGSFFKEVKISHNVENCLWTALLIASKAVIIVKCRQERFLWDRMILNKWSFPRCFSRFRAGWRNVNTRKHGRSNHEARGQAPLRYTNQPLCKAQGLICLTGRGDPRSYKLTTYNRCKIRNYKHILFSWQTKRR